MENFKKLFEAKVNFGEKGDILVIEYKNPTSFYVVKKANKKKEFQAGAEAGKFGKDATRDTDGFMTDIKLLSQGESMEAYNGFVFVGL